MDSDWSSTIYVDIELSFTITRRYFNDINVYWSIFVNNYYLIIHLEFVYSVTSFLCFGYFWWPRIVFKLEVLYTARFRISLAITSFENKCKTLFVGMVLSAWTPTFFVKEEMSDSYWTWTEVKRLVFGKSVAISSRCTI